MKIKSVLEAQLAGKPKVSSARLKRIARELSELTGAELDRYDSEEDLLILTVWKTLYHSDIDQLDAKFGEHDEFNVPEFKIPWYRWEVDGVWIIMKYYSGDIQFEVLPATTRQQPQDRYLRQRHDEIMDPARYESVMEAKYFKDDDKYQCPDCEGEGGFYIQDGPDDYDVERCEMCSGRGWLKNRDVQHLLRYNDLYKPSEFKRLKEAKYEGGSTFSNYRPDIHDNADCGHCGATFYVHGEEVKYGDGFVKCPKCKKMNKTHFALREAKYAEPNVMNLVGDFYFDDRNADDTVEYRRIAVKIKVDHERQAHEENNAVLLDDLKFVGGRPLKTAKDLGIEKGIEVGYMRDRHGWMIFGWIKGPGPHSPWNVTGN
jgi:predicted Zn finger-like uncharacterized protein